MGIFSRGGDANEYEDDLTHIRKVAKVHSEVEPLWSSTRDKADRSAPQSGPSCESASTPKKGGWFS